MLRRLERTTDMSELMLDYITSLDGFGAAEGWPGLWGMAGPEYLSFLEQDSKPEYSLLMGANTYRMFAGMAESDTEGLEELTARPKVVFSRTMQDSPRW